MTRFRATALVAFATILMAAADLSAATRQPAPAVADETVYKKPSRAIREVLDAPFFPIVWVNPTHDAMILAGRPSYPPLADLAQPMLRLAGLRIDPRTNGLHRAPYWVSMTLVRLPSGEEKRVSLPAGLKVIALQWTADGRRFAFAGQTSDGIELWIGDASTAQVQRLEGVRLNTILGQGFAWLPDQRSLVIKRIPPGRGEAPATPLVPEGPNVQEASGKSGIGSTYENRDVLKTAFDERVFDYYVRSQVAFVDAGTGAISPIGDPDAYASITVSPNGEYLLVERIRHPYSHLHPYWRFPRDVVVLKRTTGEHIPFTNLALADEVPMEGVPTGRRHYHWRPTAPATLVWAEALDGGDPSAKVPHRDRLLMQSAPFTAEPREVMRLEERFAGIAWSDSSGFVFVDEFQRERRWTRTFGVDLDAPSPSPRIFWDLSDNDRYHDPGSPLYRIRPNGSYVMHREGSSIYLSGTGASPDGDRPFLDRYDLATGRMQRLFRSDREGYEAFISWIDPAKGTFLTRRESPREPPNYQLRALEGKPAGRAKPGEAEFVSTRRALTRFPDPTPRIRGIKKRLVSYQRADGVPLTFTLYLPPGYREGTRLPTVVWAYPLEYSDAETAGQVAGSDRRFLTIYQASQLFFLLDGYAVLDNVAMPVIGHPDSVYNTFVDQITANAKAAIDKAVSLGVTDRDRVGVGGHSHGALMTANLLAHTDLFRAGIARSGAYNHTLRPFGFQTERRTLFEAPDVYVGLSPLMHADKIREPLLLIHGELDINPGTVPLQSDLLYRAIAGTGGTARLVMLPLESHGYEARESVEHTLWEMTSWFDRYVKPAPRAKARERAAR